MYSWIEGVHVIAVISWMAGMRYLPRLFVYHCGAEVGSKQSQTFKVMERRLLKAITTPAMIVAWLTGLPLARPGRFYCAEWFLAKFLLVLALTGVHGFLFRWTKDFTAVRNAHTWKFYRIINEVPTVLMFL